MHATEIVTMTGISSKTFNSSVLQFKYQKPVLAPDFQLSKQLDEKNPILEMKENKPLHNQGTSLNKTPSNLVFQYLLDISSPNLYLYQLEVIYHHGSCGLQPLTLQTLGVRGGCISDSQKSCRNFDIC